MIVSGRFFRNELKTHMGWNEVESIWWGGIVEENKPTRRIIKIDIWEESRLGIQPQISEPIWRGAKINRFHRFDM